MNEILTCSYFLHRKEALLEGKGEEGARNCFSCALGFDMHVCLCERVRSTELI